MIKDFVEADSKVTKNAEKTIIEKVYKWKTFLIKVTYRDWPTILGDHPEIKIDCKCLGFGPSIEFLKNGFANGNRMIVDDQFSVKCVDEYVQNMKLGKDLMLFL